MFRRFVLVPAITPFIADAAGGRTVARAYADNDGKAHMAFANGVDKTIKPQPEQVGCAPLTVGVKLALENWQSWQGGQSGREKGALVQAGGGYASSVYQADFSICEANSIIFPRCSGETHSTLFRKVFGM